MGKILDWLLGGSKNPPKRAGYQPPKVDESWRTHPGSPFTSFLYGVFGPSEASPPGAPEKPPTPVDRGEYPS